MLLRSTLDGDVCALLPILARWRWYSLILAFSDQDPLGFSHGRDSVYHQTRRQPSYVRRDSYLVRPNCVLAHGGTSRRPDRYLVRWFCSFHATFSPNEEFILTTASSADQEGPSRQLWNFTSHNPQKRFFGHPAPPEIRGSSAFVRRPYHGDWSHTSNCADSGSIDCHCGWVVGGTSGGRIVVWDVQGGEPLTSVELFKGQSAPFDDISRLAVPHDSSLNSRSHGLALSPSDLARGGMRVFWSRAAHLSRSLCYPHLTRFVARRSWPACFTWRSHPPTISPSISSS